MLRGEEVWKDAILGSIVLLWIDCDLNRIEDEGRVEVRRLVAEVGNRLEAVNSKLCRSTVLLASDAMAMSDTVVHVDDP